VVDDEGGLIGLVTRKDLRAWIDEGDGARSLADVARKPVLAYPDEPLRLVVYRMAETGHVDLPVVDRANPKKLLGRVTLRHLLKARLRHLEEERRRQGILPINLVRPPWLRSSAFRRVPNE
jgi:CBS-domain-containing membrane protein